MIAPQWSDTESYAQWAVVIYDHVLYFCDVVAATVGEFKPDEWVAFNLADALMGNI